MTDLPVDFPLTLVLILCAGGVLLGGLLLLPQRLLSSRLRACLLGGFWLLLVGAAAYLAQRAAALAVALAALVAILTVPILARWPRLVEALRWRHLPAVLLIVGALLSALAWSRHLSDVDPHRSSAEEHPAPDYKIALIEAGEAKTDAGRPVSLGTFGELLSEAGLEEYEDYLIGTRDLGFKSIALTDPDPSYNCHGWVFAGGQYWIGSDEVDRILTDNQYAPVTTPQPGDLVIYRDGNENIVHSGVVHTVVDTPGDDLTLVESKWGPLGRYIHPTADQPDGRKIRYHRSRRRGHRLRGL